MAAVIKLGEVGSPDPDSGGEEELSFQNYSLEMMEAVGGLQAARELFVRGIGTPEQEKCTPAVEIERYSMVGCNICGEF